MIAEAVKFSGKKGIKIKRKNFYVELILNSGTKEEPNLVYIYVNAKCGPEKYLGKEVRISIDKDSFTKSPVEENKTIIYTDDIRLA